MQRALAVRHREIRRIQTERANSSSSVRFRESLPVMRFSKRHSSLTSSGRWYGASYGYPPKARSASHTYVRRYVQAQGITVTGEWAQFLGVALARCNFFLRTPERWSSSRLAKHKGKKLREEFSEELRGGKSANCEPLITRWRWVLSRVRKLTILHFSRNINAKAELHIRRLQFNCSIVNGCFNKKKKKFNTNCDYFYIIVSFRYVRAAQYNLFLLVHKLHYTTALW